MAFISIEASFSTLDENEKLFYMFSMVKLNLCERLEQNVLNKNFRPIIGRTSKLATSLVHVLPLCRSAIAGKPDSAAFESFQQLKHVQVPSINRTVPGR